MTKPRFKVSVSTDEDSGRLLAVYIRISDEGGYTAHVPALPGCISEGDTLEEARHNIREAIELYLEPDDEWAVPDGALVEEIAV